MNRKLLLDTGPLVAFLSRRDQHHKWAEEQLSAVDPPLLSCEAVISEACFLLREHPRGVDAVMELIERQLVVLSFRLSDELESVRKLLRRYAEVPMSLADACLVRMSEMDQPSVLLTTDSDFRDVYRKNRKQVIPTISP